VKKSGITFAVARCVRENGGVDATFARNVAGQRRAGLIPGAYAFLAGGGVATAQARTFIQTIGDPTGMLTMLDIERPTFHPSPTLADVQAFVAEWRRAHPQHPLLLYGSSGAVLGKIGRLASLHASGPLWLAFFREGVGTAPGQFYESIGGNAAQQWRLAFSGWPGPAIWQFTSKQVRVPGVAKNIDTNAFRGTRAQLLALTGKKAAMGPTITAAPLKPAKRFHVVKRGETLSGIAARFGFGGFRKLIAMFPENKRFAANPSLIHPGDRVRVA
jgi:GH25 family lysozyme M1 (1,4-beta-N-acetylmuramidase)